MAPFEENNGWEDLPSTTQPNVAPSDGGGGGGMSAGDTANIIGAAASAFNQLFNMSVGLALKSDPENKKLATRYWGSLENWLPSVVLLITVIMFIASMAMTIKNRKQIFK